MKKIGIIDKVELSGPGTKNIFYETESDRRIYVNQLSVTIIDDQSGELKSLIPKFNKNKFYLLGDIIEYDTQTMGINDFDIFREMTAEEINQINYIYEKYRKRLNDTSNFSLDKALAKASNLEEIRITMETFLFNNSERIHLEAMLNNIKKQMLMRNNQQLNITSCPKR